MTTKLIIENNIQYTVKTHADGDKFWYLNGKYHREDGPAIEYGYGDKYWYLNGKLHREDGPAVELADRSKYWYRNDNLHREDGPAIELADGSKEWWLNDKKLPITTNEQFKRIIKLKALL